jgi:glutamyl-tRNA synthetase
VNKAGARFDPDKTKWFNHQYLVKKTNDELTQLYVHELNKHKINTTPEKARRIVELTKERANFISDLWEQSKFFFIAPQTYDESFIKKHWKAETPDIMKEIRNAFMDVVDFKAATLEQTIKLYTEEKQVGFGSIMNPLRACLVGAGKGPHLPDIIEILGKQEVIDRIDNALSQL